MKKKFVNLTDENKLSKIKMLYKKALTSDFDIKHEYVFNDEIKAAFGTFEGKMVIDLYPTFSKKGWMINFDFFRLRYRPFYAKKDSKVKVHGGYLKEWYRNREEFFNIIEKNNILRKSLKNGLIITGRSKGASEASIIAIDIIKNFEVDTENTFLGMIASPKTGNKAFAKSIEKYIPKENIYNINYGADIVTKIPFFYHNPGYKIKINPRCFISFKDHETACYGKSVIFEILETKKNLIFIENKK